MATCSNDKFKGALVAVRYQFGCGDALPNPAAWKRVGAMRGKEMNLEWETVDGTTDDSVGALRENLTTFKSFGISGDGLVKISDGTESNLTELTKHVAAPAGGSPVAWMQMIYPDLTFTAFMNITNMSRTAPYDDLATYSLEASATASDFGLIVEDTPNPNALPVASVTMPATETVVVGATVALAATVLPAGASQTVQYSSAAQSIATVNPMTGVVTGVSVGTAVITATSIADPTKTGQTTVTVTAE